MDFNLILLFETACNKSSGNVEFSDSDAMQSSQQVGNAGIEVVGVNSVWS